MECIIGRLKDDLRGKEKQNSTLDEEIATLRSSAAAKDRALARFKSEAETTREKLTQTEGKCAALQNCNEARIGNGIWTEVYTLDARWISHSKVQIRSYLKGRNWEAILLYLTGELANKARELRALEAERNKLQSTVQGVEREADKLHRRLSASTKVMGMYCTTTSMRLPGARVYLMPLLKCLWDCQWALVSWSSLS